MLKLNRIIFLIFKNFIHLLIGFSTPGKSLVGFFSQLISPHIFRSIFCVFRSIYLSRGPYGIDTFTKHATMTCTSFSPEKISSFGVHHLIIVIQIVSPLQFPKYLCLPSKEICCIFLKLGFVCLFVCLLRCQFVWQSHDTSLVP